MSSSVKVGNTWRNIPSKHTKQSGTWHEIVKGLEKKDGVWIVYYSSGALVGFTNYPDPIPVMAGWQYKTNGATSWTDITSNGEINSSGTFTGVVRAKSVLTLDEWYSEEGVEVGQQNLQITGTPLSVARTGSTSFVNGNKGYVCTGGMGYDTSPTSYSQYQTVDVYDISGNRTTGNGVSYPPRVHLTSFVNGNKAYVCGGIWSRSGYTNVNIYDASGNRTTGTDLSEGRGYLTSFVNGNKGYVCGGTDDGNASTVYFSTVDVYDSSGNRTTGTSLSSAKRNMTSFVNNSKGYVCGGYQYSVATYSTVDVYDTSGNRTTGNALSAARQNLTSFVNGNRGYVCGGENPNNNYGTTTVDVYDISGNRTTGTALSEQKCIHTSFVNNSKGYVCGGLTRANSPNSFSKVIDVYDISGNRTSGGTLSAARDYMTSFVNGNRGYVCGGGDYSATLWNYLSSATTIFYDEEIPYTIAKIPITAGSTYTLNGTGGTASSSQVLTFNEKVSGTVEYKKGEIPS